MELPELKIVSHIFIAVLECTLLFKYFEKKDLSSSGISEVIDSETHAYLNA